MSISLPRALTHTPTHLQRRNEEGSSEGEKIQQADEEGAPPDAKCTDDGVVVPEGCAVLQNQLEGFNHVVEGGVDSVGVG